MAHTRGPGSRHHRPAEPTRRTRKHHIVGGTWARCAATPSWTLQIGGHPNSANWDPVEVARDEDPDGGDWLLLATWQCGADVEELDHGLVHWVIRRQDLADLRFNRVYGYVDMI